VNSNRLRLLLLAIPVLSACNLPPLDPDDNWDKGARTGRIMETYAAALPTTALPECLAALPKSDLAARRFVRVRYPHIRQSLTTIAEIPAGLNVAVGDLVEVWPHDCSEGKVSQVTRLLQ
jgi:hypothetical protein